MKFTHISQSRKARSTLTLGKKGHHPAKAQTNFLPVKRFLEWLRFCSSETVTFLDTGKSLEESDTIHTRYPTKVKPF